MRKKLREVQEQISLRDTLRTLKSQIEYILWYLRNTNSSAGSDTSAGGSSETIDTVLTLPPIPTTAGQSRTVYWTSSGGGTGDNQHWQTRNGKTRWYPMWFPTTKNGTPGS